MHLNQRFLSQPLRQSLLVFLVGLAAYPGTSSGQTQQAFTAARQRMVDQEIVAAGVKNAQVIDAMRRTPRHEFMPVNLRAKAYYDMALPIGHAQTISPPFIVAYMTEQIDPQLSDKVLEIGTGSGYQAAVLSGLVKEVYTIEIVEPLGRKAAAALKRLKFDNVHVKVGDGYLGWPEHAPFDKIIVTCSPEKVPSPLVEQLKEGGRMIIPVGERYQQTLYLYAKKNGQLEKEALKPTLFVPMTGEAEEQRRVKPDPSRPSVRNGDFEDVSGDPPQVSGWHYQRQMEVVADDGAPSGKNYVRFANHEPGRGSQCLQGLAVDGQRVKELRVTLWVRGKDIRNGQTADQLPIVMILFYDENRGNAGQAVVGPWQGTFAWRKESKVVPVPPRAREAVVHLGLRGATGELSMDDVRIERAGGREK